MDFQKTPGFGDDDGYEPACGYDAEIELWRSAISDVYKKPKDIGPKSLTKFRTTIAKRLGVKPSELYDAFDEVTSIRGVHRFVADVCVAFPHVLVEGQRCNLVDMRAVMLTTSHGRIQRVTKFMNRGNIDSNNFTPRLYYRPHAKKQMRDWRKILQTNKVDPNGAGVRIFAERPNETLLHMALSTINVWRGVDETLTAFIDLARSFGVNVGNVQEVMRIAA